MWVYKVTNTVTGMGYIGITAVGVAERFKLHLRDGSLPKPKRYLHRAIAKYGPEAFVVETLREASSADELLALERDLVASHGTLAPAGYNMTSGGEELKEWCEDLRREASVAKRAWAASERGRSFLKAAAAKSKSEESKKKRAESHRRWLLTPEGQRQSQLRIAAMHTPEVRAKVSATMYGRKLPESTKLAMAAAQRGRKHSEATRQKMSETRKRRWQDPEYRAQQVARTTAAMADPAARERIRQSNLKTWLDPELKRRHSAKLVRKMSDTDCIDALARLASGEAVRSVAERYQVTIQLIYQLRSGLIRKHLTRP